MTSTNRLLRTAATAVAMGVLFATPMLAQQTAPTPPLSERRMMTVPDRAGPPMGARRGPPTVDDRVQRMTAELGLNADQANRLRATFLAEQRTTDSILARRAAAMDAERAAMQAMHANTQKAITGVLTADQKIRFEAMRARMADRGPMGGPGMMGGRDGMRMRNAPFRTRDDRNGPDRNGRPGGPPPDERNDDRSPR